MPGYDVLFRVDPPRVFGLVEAGIMVVQAGTNPTFHLDFAAGTSWATREDGSDSQREYEKRLLMEFDINGLHVEVDDNAVLVSLRGVSADAAVAHARRELERLLRLVVTSFPGLDFTISAYAVRVTEDGVVLHRRPEMSGGLYAYDVDHMRAAILRAVTLTDGLADDLRLEQALKYFVLGEKLLSLHEPWSSDDDFDSITPIRFLQYWKSLTTIIGDPSSDADHQSRSKLLGLGRHFYKHEASPLHDLRNRFDVAHVANPEAPRVVSPGDAVKCRAAAARAIAAYIRTRNTS